METSVSLCRGLLLRCVLQARSPPARLRLGAPPMWQFCSCYSFCSLFIDHSHLPHALLWALHGLEGLVQTSLPLSSHPGPIWGSSLCTPLSVHVTVPTEGSYILLPKAQCSHWPCEGGNPTITTAPQRCTRVGANLQAQLRTSPAGQGFGIWGTFGVQPD